MFVLIEDGQDKHEAREYVSPLNHLTYVEGLEGVKFTLRITNDTLGRILAIPSVDGLSILDGKSAGTRSSGYIIDACDFIDIPGWTVDKSTVARFVFSGSRDAFDQSYVAQIGGEVENKGVIGAIIFTEDAPKDVLFSKSILYDKSPEDRSLSQSLGTGFGEAATFETRTVDFKRGERIATLLIHYDDVAGLKRYGIEVARSSIVPNAFPSDDVGCTPPPNWRR